ncbi:MAG: hypothetical protein WDZ75_00560 [Candidatus Paceibacterota bacterium]
MLYLLYGSRHFIKNESTNIKSALLAKRADAISLSYDGATTESFDLEESTSGQGLFQTRYIVELIGMFEGEQLPNPKEAIIKIKESENIFLVLEEKLPKKILDLLKENAERTMEEKNAPAKKEKDFSAFSLADALALRDKKRLWILFREALSRGYKVEELHGILFWQMKTIVLAYKTTSAEDAGIKPFPYSKAVSAKKKYTQEEAEELLHALSGAILEGRSGSSSLENSLEKVILSL